MKKIYSLVCAIAISSMGFAQSQLLVPGKKLTTKASFNKSELRATNKQSNSAVSRTASGNGVLISVVLQLLSGFTI
ncbi:MAG: hypothetical protein HY062_15375 [Bacteroidetes bacterium]|nr:hypothetical protein [Bacteroidota bacterium]